ncbi:MAG: hypothetical protein ACYDAO_05665 [Thermoplasmataceae archaeon]
MSNFQDPRRLNNQPRKQFKQAKGDFEDWVENKITNGDVDLLEAGYHGIKGLTEEVKIHVNGYTKADGTRVRPHIKTVNRNRTQGKRSSNARQKG